MNNKNHLRKCPTMHASTMSASKLFIAYAWALCLSCVMLLTSCQSKLVMQKAVYQQGKIIPVDKPVVFNLHENDTITVIKRVR